MNAQVSECKACTCAKEEKEGSKTAISLFSSGCIPKTLRHNMLIKELSKIDIGNVFEIDDEYVSSLELDACVNGTYRDLREYQS